MPPWLSLPAVGFVKPVMRYAAEPPLVAMGLTGMIYTPISTLRARYAGLACSLFLVMAGAASAASSVSKAQERAAAEFLAAAASGDPQSVAYAIHPEELDALRQRLLTKMRDEAKRNDSTIRGRLFGVAMPLADLEHLTSVGFYTTLARRIQLGGRPYREVNGITAIPDKNGVVLVVVRGKPPKELGTVSILHVVAMKPYGKDWKAVVPAQIEAQIEDLETGRRNAPPPPPAAAAAAGAAKPPGTATVPAESGLPPAITELLSNAEKALERESLRGLLRSLHEPEFPPGDGEEGKRGADQYLSQQRRQSRDVAGNDAHRPRAGADFRVRRAASRLRPLGPGSALRPLRAGAGGKALVHRGVSYSRSSMNFELR